MSLPTTFVDSLLEACMVDFLFALIELFPLSIMVPGYELGCFRRGSTSLQSNFIWTMSSPISHSWHQKTRDTGLPDGKDRMPLCSLILTQYRSVTDRRMDVPQHIQRLQSFGCCKNRQITTGHPQVKALQQLTNQCKTTNHTS